MTSGKTTTNRLLAALPRETLASLAPDVKEMSLLQGTVILEPGDPIEHIYFPHTGMISLVITTKDGGTIETATIGREGAVGLTRGLGERRWLTRATVQIAGIFSVVRGARFEQVVRDNIAVRDVITQYTEVQWSEAQQIAACNATHEAASRLCRWMLQTSDRIGDDNLPLTQEFLAQMLGVRRTTVTLLAQSMQEKGLIKYTRGRILLLDRAGIEDCACECYHAIQQDHLPTRIGFNF
jgi:CRP-like cAMP-binding protein